MSILSDAGSRCDAAVSSVVGEMIMVALVLLLIAIFSSSILSFLPVERYPSVTVMVTNDTLGNITFWHKGGDWIRISDLKVRVENSTGTVVIPDSVTAGRLVVFPDKATFDLGSNITVYAGPVGGGESVRLVTSRAVLFNGRLGAGYK